MNYLYLIVRSNFMKTKFNLFIFGIFITLLSCKQVDDKKNENIVTTDTLNTSFKKIEKERLETRKEIEEQNKIDSLNLDKFLKNAIKIAEENIGFNKFKKGYIETMPDSSYEVKVSINSDFYFSKKNPHFIIRRHTPGITYVDIFSKNGRGINKVLSHEEWNMTYVNDTIRDINGDGLKDYVINWYGSTGCCLKAFSIIYLLRPDKKTFSNNLEFINPTFSPKEKIIRGVCYGHPSETEMYKYKWNGEKVDTLEYISYEKNQKGFKTGKIIISSERPFGKNFKVLKRINSVPKEYKLIDGYEWFTGEGY